MDTNARAHLDRGDALVGLRRLDDAVGAYAEAVRLGGGPDAEVALAETLEAVGRVEEARALVRDRFRSDHPGWLVLRTRIALDEGEPLEALAEAHLALLERVGRGAAVHLLFGLGRIRDRQARYPEAFRWIAEANRVVGARFDREAFAARLDRIRAAWAQPGPRSARSEGVVAIVGMPRCGSTLVAQVLAAHPDVVDLGEHPALQLLARQVPWPVPVDQVEAAAARLFEALGPGRVVVTKTLADLEWVGLLGQVLPRSQVVHVRRDPVDTCWSCFATRFDGAFAFAYDLGDLGFVHRAYDRLAAHWAATEPDRFVAVGYEDLVTDPEVAFAALFARLGLDWDPAFPLPARRPVATQSTAAVRAPIHAGAIGRSAPYRPWLGPLLSALQTPSS